MIHKIQSSSVFRKVNLKIADTKLNDVQIFHRSEAHVHDQFNFLNLRRDMDIQYLRCLLYNKTYAKLLL